VPVEESLYFPFIASCPLVKRRRRNRTNSVGTETVTPVTEEEAEEEALDLTQHLMKRQMQQSL
tara:strand:+ start:26 stop:214 length:189 start_codon:yes stop_codon:yes gene_type:complete